MLSAVPSSPKPIRRFCLSRARRAIAASALLTVAIAAADLARGGTARDRIAVEERGTGSPAIVLIHGLGGDRTDWNRVAPSLAARHRVLLVDLPGHGESSPPAGQPTVQAAATAVGRELAERKVERAVLVGHSYGGLVALLTALDQPKRVSAVVTVDVATYTSADPERLASADQVLRERYPVFINAVFGAMSQDPARGDSLAKRAARVPQPVLAGYFRDAWRQDLRGRIKGLKIPVHVVATDALWPVGESWSSARQRLGYETSGPAVGYRVGASGHMVPMDRPDSLATIIESIASKLPR